MSRPIRILQIVPNMQSGGLENLIINIYRNIDRQKVQFDFLVHYKEKKFFDDEIEKLGGKIYRFSLRNDNNILKYIKELDSFYKEHSEYKVIHCHMSSIGFINFLIAKKNGIKVRIAHSHNSLTDKTFKGKMKRIMMLPYKYISTINYACSNEAGKYLYGNKKFTVIPNAIDVEKFKYKEEYKEEIRKRYSIPKDAMLFGHIGRFNIQKNHKFIIKIFYEYHQKNPNSYLMLIGEGELKEKIKKIVQDLKIEKNIIFAGSVSDTWKYYSAFDIFLLPSLFEGLPLVGVEAQTSGVKCFFEENITKELIITDLVTYLPLVLEKWTEEIENFKEINERNKYSDIVKDSKFNITLLSKKLEKEYVNLYNKEN